MPASPRLVDQPAPARPDAAGGVKTTEVVCGAVGCEAAARQQAAAVMVDALRASATITALVAAGARRVWVATEIEQARAMKELLDGDALLVGERDGFPPPGFDIGNSPRAALDLDLDGRVAVFTSTTGSARLGELEGAALAVVGSPVNAGVVARVVGERAAGSAVFSIAAGLRGSPGGTEEDWIGAALIADRLRGYGFEWINGELGESGYWPAVLDADNVRDGFFAGAHGRVLVEKGLRDDVEDCARLDWIDAVAAVVDYRRIDDGPPLAALERIA